MKRRLILSALGLAVACASSAASAHVDVGVYLGAPGPVYVAPPPVMYQPPPVVYAPGGYAYGYENRGYGYRYDDGDHHHHDHDDGRRHGDWGHEGGHSHEERDGSDHRR
ncbi:hypothetical protein SAMN02787142_0603 [Burkholderia sp. WP9]|uniref:hypothetical protein n=1 Tax=Burkholderia sp. WP9 TaxID=1500263 RepID=UPI000899C46C|nr:hypothetical protein [Burkholderia sp. WP9]SEB94298.1 hypothetical protein SAMN02787142_0603 [Burkholderia sp. WP9]